MKTSRVSDSPWFQLCASNAPRAAGFAVLLGLFGCHLALYTTEFFPVDDAYISFRYAANLAQGEGLVFNVGERVEGYSNFLFITLLAAGSKLGITPPLAARLINIASVVFLLGALVFGRSRYRSRGGETQDDLDGRPATEPMRTYASIGWLAGLVLVLSTHTVLNVLSGLEAPATAALLAAGVILLGRNQPKPAAFIFLLVALSRPEGIVLALLAAAWDVLSKWKEFRSRLQIWLVSLAVPYGIFFIWRIVYYGSLLPSSVQAKSGSDAGLQLKRALSYMERASDVYWPLMVLAVIGLLVGCRQRLVPVRAAWVALLGVIGLCFVTGSGDPYVTLLRYLYPGLPLLLMVASASAEALLGRSSALSRRPFKISLAACVFLLLTCQLLVVTYRSASELLRRDNFQVLKRVGVQEKISLGLAQIFSQDRAPHTSERLKVAIGQHDLARWLLDHATSDAALVSSQVGIAPYYTGLKVIDTFGLVTRHIAELPGAPGGKRDPDFVFGQDPDFFAFKKPRKLTGGIAADVQLFRDRRFRLRYDLVRMFNLGGPRLLLFQRRDRPVFDIHYDFVDQFLRRRVGWLDGESWLVDGSSPNRGFVAKYNQIQFFGKRKRKNMRRALDSVFGGAGVDFAGADAMRQWLGQWRSFIEHRPGSEVANAIRYRVQIPEDAFLNFGLGAPPWNMRSPKRERKYAGAVRYSILVEHEGDVTPEGEQRTIVRRQVFSSIQNPKRKPAHRLPRQFEVDLRSYAGQEVIIYFQADRMAANPDRGGWIEPLLIRRAPGAEELTSEHGPAPIAGRDTQGASEKE